MIHTGDQYESRARAARHHELRRLHKALTGLLFAQTVSSSERVSTSSTGTTDQTSATARAA